MVPSATWLGVPLSPAAQQPQRDDANLHVTLCRRLVHHPLFVHMCYVRTCAWCLWSHLSSVTKSRPFVTQGKWLYRCGAPAWTLHRCTGLTFITNGRVLRGKVCLHEHKAHTGTSNGLLQSHEKPPLAAWVPLNACLYYLLRSYFLPDEQMSRCCWEYPKAQQGKAQQGKVMEERNGVQEESRRLGKNGKMANCKIKN